MPARDQGVTLASARGDGFLFVFRLSSIPSTRSLLPEEVLVALGHLRLRVRAGLQAEGDGEEQRRADDDGAADERERRRVHLAARAGHAAPVHELVRVPGELEDRGRERGEDGRRPEGGGGGDATTRDAGGAGARAEGAAAAGARRADANARAEVSEGEGGGHRAGAEVRREVGARGCVC